MNDSQAWNFKHCTPKLFKKMPAWAFITGISPVLLYFRFKDGDTNVCHRSNWSLGGVVPGMINLNFLMAGRKQTSVVGGEIEMNAEKI